MGHSHMKTLTNLLFFNYLFPVIHMGIVFAKNQLKILKIQQ